jgi:hypothetical protein
MEKHALENLFVAFVTSLKVTGSISYGDTGIFSSPSSSRIIPLGSAQPLKESSRGARRERSGSLSSLLSMSRSRECDRLDVS